MSKYGTIAVCAAKKVREGNGLCPISAWKTSAEEIFPEQKEKTGREKSCPRCAFLGLAEEGLIRGIRRGHYVNSYANKLYAIEAVKLLQTSPELSDDPPRLWEYVMRNLNKTVKHNDQMSVVVALWKNSGIAFDSVD